VLSPSTYNIFNFFMNRSTPHVVINNNVLCEVLNEARSVKTQDEIKLMSYVNKICSHAHVRVMQECGSHFNKRSKKNTKLMEYQLESIFLHDIYYNGGCRYVSYTPICGAGENSAILHYGHAGMPNNAGIKKQDLVLVDMGAEYHRYASDITCTFPASGVFTERQKIIYNRVLYVQRETIKIIRPGIEWRTIDAYAKELLLMELIKLNLVKGSLNDMIKDKVVDLFMPHSIGHLLGLDTHDVSNGRIILRKNMALTVEPGIYFIKYLIKGSKKAKKYLNHNVLREYENFGGVRIEDSLIVTNDGTMNMTKCPRTVEEIEHVMRGGDWLIK